MVIRAPNDIPLAHKWLEGLVHHNEAPMEESAAEISKDLFVDIFSTT